MAAVFVVYMLIQWKRFLQNIAMQIVVMIVTMCVGRQAFGYFLAEELHKSRIVTDMIGMAMATDMLVQAHHFVCLCHHPM